MFRMLFLTFFGEYRGDGREHMYSAMLAKFGRGGHVVYHDHHDDGNEDHAHAHVPHESPLPIVAAISILALLGLFGGHFWLTQGDPLLKHGTEPWFVKLASPDSMYGHDVGGWIAPYPTEAHALEHYEQVHHVAHGRALITSMLVVIVGLISAVFLYLMRRDLPAVITAKLGIVYETVRDKYYIDEVVNATVIACSMWTSRALTWFDASIVDGLVNLLGRTGKFAGSFSAWIDRTFVDGAVNGVALVTQAFGSVVRLFQSGRIQQYATFAVAGALMAAAWLILM